MVYIVYYDMFLFLDYVRFGLELVNQNMFEMKILK